MQLCDPVTCKVAVNNQPFIKVITAFSNPLRVQKVGEGPVLSCRDSEVTLKVVVFSFFLLFTVRVLCSPPLSGSPQPVPRMDANYLELILIILMSW